MSEVPTVELGPKEAELYLRQELMRFIRKELKRFPDDMMALVREGKIRTIEGDADGVPFKALFYQDTLIAEVRIVG